MRKCRLLVIEDDKSIADLICRVATEAGYDVQSTCDYTKIASLYDEFLPQIIVLDIIMPNMDGFEVLKFLHMRNSSSRIVILSGQYDYRSMMERLGSGLNLDIVASVAKPFRLVDLRQTLEKIKYSLPVTKKILPGKRPYLSRNGS
jgi:two-component system OmpR family response regulator